MKLRLQWDGVRVALDTDDMDETDGPSVVEQVMRGVSHELRRGAKFAREEAETIRGWKQPKQDEVDRLMDESVRFDQVARRLDRCRRDHWGR